MLFIIWGFKHRWSVKRDETGQFFCPRCGGDRNWVRAVARRWFTLFWIPLFPTGKTVAEAVQCDTCGTRFDASVLQQPTSSELASELQGSMRLCVVAVTRAAGATATAAGVEAVQRTGLAPYDSAALSYDVDNLDLSSLDAHLSYLSESLTLPGKEQFLSSLVHVANAAGGSGSGEAKQALERIGASLGLSPAHVAGVMVSPAPSSAVATEAPPPPPRTEGEA